MEEIKAYKCGVCKHTYDREQEVLECEFKHARYNYANILLNKGYTLSSINYLCGFNWQLIKEQEDITKDNCFVISHWQGCNKPAYQIRRIEENGYVYVRGKGGWSGYYGSDIKVDQYYLKKPYPKEDLYVCDK